MVASVVENQHIRSRLDVAGNDIPGRDHEIVASGKHIGMRQAAGGDDDHLWVLRENCVRLRPVVEVKGDAQSFALAHAPVDDADHLTTAFALRRQPDLAAGIVGGLENDDFMAALGADACGLEPGRPCADNHHLPAFRRFGYLVRHGFLTARCRIMDAEGETALIDAVETVIGANTGANIILPFFHDLAHDMRIGHVRAGHAHHVHLTSSDGVARGGDIGDLGGVECREAGRGADFTGEIEMRRVGHALNGDDVGQARVGVDMAPDDIEIIDKAAVLQPSGDFDALSLSGAALETFVGGITDTEDEIIAHAFAHRPENVETKAHAVFKRAAIGAVQFVGQRRDELVDQMAIGFQLHTVHPTRLHAFRGVGEVLDDTLDIPVLDLLRKSPMRRFAVM
ncbi:hypothetical protein D3C71_689640 [compost metagenome]